MNDLLSNCTSGGCGAKIGPGELSSLLNPLKGEADARLLVGFDSGDDAAVYQLNGEQCVVSTVDFFPPMVNDPYLFGKIAAANALSDVYAMGADPIFALNLVCFPEKLDKSVLAEILAGGSDKLREAGVLLAGGHSIYDKEIKYGLAVTGQVSPDKLLRNDTAKCGDILILTKPLGVGVVMAANRVELADTADYAAATQSMQQLNQTAAKVARAFPISACTDVTGFGLLAHLGEMAGDRVTLEITPKTLPLLPGAYRYASEYLLTAAGQRNRNFIAQKLDTASLSQVDAPLQELMFDPQTSGGLLLSVAAEHASLLLAALHEVSSQAAIIGRVREKTKATIIFV